jgi:hypothetical protein
MRTSQQIYIHITTTLHIHHTRGGLQLLNLPQALIQERRYNTLHFPPPIINYSQQFLFCDENTLIKITNF